MNTEVATGIPLILNSLLLGAGLAMDAFSVSVANGLEEPSMKKSRVCAIAGVYALFQFAMPLAGWFFVHSGFAKRTQGDKQEEEPAASPKKLTAAVILVQGLATSIDALSVGFTISGYRAFAALLSSLIIGAVTFAICAAGLVFGKKLGERFADKATVIGGFILIGIGLEILIKSFI